MRRADPPSEESYRLSIRLKIWSETKRLTDILCSRGSNRNMNERWNLLVDRGLTSSHTQTQQGSTKRWKSIPHLKLVNNLFCIRKGTIMIFGNSSVRILGGAPAILPDFSWYSSVCQGKCWERSSKRTADLFLNIFHFIIHQSSCHSMVYILRYCERCEGNHQGIHGVITPEEDHH
jgi:hypothetical protein